MCAASLARRESRWEEAMATFTVTNTDDYVAGVEPPVDGSLRLAIAQANAAPGRDEIAFDPAVEGGTLVLTGGELAITDDLTIDGPGADPFTIDADRQSRVFNIDDGEETTRQDITLNSLVLTGGALKDEGGGVRNAEFLLIIDSEISDNAAELRGGGVFNTGDMRILESAVTENRLTSDGSDVSGGGVFSQGFLTIQRSLISENSDSGDVDASNGGGVFSDGFLWVRDSAITGNRICGLEAALGGGLYATGRADISNSTISNNSSDTSGFGGGYSGAAGIAVRNADVQIGNSTVVRNTAYSYGGQVPGYDYFSGGIYEVYAAGGTASNLVISSSIVASNAVIAEYSGARAPADLRSENVTSGGNNLVGSGDDAGGAFVDGIDGDIVGTADDPVDPLIGPLALNGGPTPTHALLVGSPAIGAGANPENLRFDQRGEGFARSVNGTDIGAYEVQAGALPPTLTDPVVDTLVDEFDGDVGAGDLSLREAIELATDGSTITFADDVQGGTITLTLGELAITRSLKIEGGEGTTIDADGASRVIRVDDGDASQLHEVVFDGLTITGGEVTGGFRQPGGGGVYSVERLTLLDSVVAGNLVRDGVGGGIHATGPLEVVRSDIRANEVLGGLFSVEGGGIASEGDLSVAWSRISDNRAITGLIGPGEFIDDGYFARGAGIEATSLTVRNSVVSDNYAKGVGRDGAVAGINASQVEITSSSIYNNYALSGGRTAGGLNIDGGLIQNTTVSGNTGRQTRLGEDNYSVPAAGGILTNGPLGLANSTVFANYATIGEYGQGAGGVHNWTYTPGAVAVTSSIVAENGIGGIRGAAERADIGRPFNDYGYGPAFVGGGNNLIGIGNEQFTDGVDGDIVGTADDPVDPLIGDLALNGGPTPTHALLPDSPAIDAGANPLALVNDQRGEGFARVVNGQADIGAFEVQAAAPPPIEGTDGRDRLIGTPGPDLILAFAGDDLVFADAGDDVIRPGPGVAQINTGPGADRVELAGRAGTAVIYDLDVDAGDRLGLLDAAFLAADGGVDLDLLDLTTTGSFTLLEGRADGETFPLASLRDVGEVELETLFGVGNDALLT